MARRVLLFGTTGIDKREACKKLAVEAVRRGKRFESFDFERDFLSDPVRRHVRSFTSYLSQDVFEQARARKAAWPDFVRAVAHSNADVVVGLVHATVVRHFYGVRIGVDVGALCSDFAPDLIVTLIDDVYVKWWRTEMRADGDAHRGRPSLEQLVMARRCEGMVGDLVSATMQTAHNRFARHVVLAVNHPVRTLAGLVFDNSKVAYLSFPISAPRRQLKNGDPSLIQHVNRFHHAALAAQRSNPGVVFVSPLAIDELPFVNSVPSSTPNNTHFAFDLEQERWSTADLWPQEELIAQPLPTPSVRPGIPVSQIRGVHGIVETDVGWRDNCLVIQADALAVFSPAMPHPDGDSRLARGVREEIERAGQNRSTRSFVYQDPGLDPNQKWAEYYGAAGSMGLGPGHEFVRSCASVNEVFTGICGALQ